MRRLSAILVTALLLMLFSVNFSASAGYSIGEAEFDIPIEFSVFYGEGELSEMEDFRFVAPDNSVELSCYHMKNTDGISFAFMNLTDAVDYFFDNISAINGDDFIFESVQNYYDNGLSTGVLIEGYVDKSAESIPVYVYAFSTEDNLYGFEFKVYNSSGTEFVNEFINSLYFTSQDASIGDEEGEVVSVLEIVCMLLIIIVCFTVVFIYKKIGREAFWAGVESKEAPSEKQIKPKLTKEKFELNGKSINGINERFTVGKADDNFALDELNRERKERERMFNKGE